MRKKNRENRGRRLPLRYRLQASRPVQAINRFFDRLRYRLAALSYTDPCQGPIGRQILLSTLPILLFTLIQQLYTTLDLAIIGNYGQSETALGAVGTDMLLTNLYMQFPLGISLGISVLIAQYYGRREADQLESALHTSLAIGLVCGLLITFLGEIFAEEVLHLMNTPEEQMAEALNYLCLALVGITPYVIFTFVVAILRSVGDSSHPLHFMVSMMAVNLLLELLFVKVFQWGVRGEALAMVIAQFLAAILGLITLARSDTIYRLYPQAWPVDRPMGEKILKISLPTGFQLFLAGLANTLIQSQINRYGAAAASGYAVAMRVDALFYLMADSFNLSITTFCAQNIGAGKKERAKKGAKTASLMAVLTTLLIGLIIFILRSPIYKLFNLTEEGWPYADDYVIMACLTYWLYAASTTLSGALRGAGRVNQVFTISMVFMVAFRFLWIFLCRTFFPGYLAINLVFPLSWLGLLVTILIYAKRTDWTQN